MKNILIAVIVLAIAKFAPNLFFWSLAVIALVFLLTLFYHRHIVMDELMGERRKKRAGQHLQRLSEQLATAQAALASGDERPMRALAEQASLADAWNALAEAWKAAPEAVRDEVAITQAYLRAIDSKWHINENYSWKSEYDKRYFLGIGATTDYGWLIQQWGEGYLRGYGHEVDLAWILTFGPEQLRNHERAWLWLSLGKARTSSVSSFILSSEEQQKIQATLEASVSGRARAKLDEEAKDEAYAEFVAGT